jgi:Tol biopolymer transport system component
MPERHRLDAWKGIANYLGRDVTTVRRWEKREGLPVHRHLHEKLGSVYAFTDEIDDWWQQRSKALAHPAPSDPTHHEAVATPSDAESTSSAQAPAIARPHGVWWSATGILLALVALTAALMSGPWLPQARGRDDSAQSVLTPPAGAVVDTTEISPDGRYVVFSARDAEGARLWIRELKGSMAIPIPGTDGASFPFWSADGQHIGFFAGGLLKSVTSGTFEVRSIAVAPHGRGGAWNDRGDILFAPDAASPLMRTPAAGGAARDVTTLGRTVTEGHAWPQFLPDGRRFLYTDYTIDGRRYGIYVGDLGTGVVKRVLPAYTSAHYSAGFLVYSLPSKRALVAHAFDLERLELVGEPFAVLHRPVHRVEVGHYVEASVSREGVLVARSAEDEESKLAWFDRRSGKVTGTVSAPGSYSNPVLSPDGGTLAATVSDDPVARIWLFDTRTGQGTRLTSGIADYAPLWSPGGDRLLYSSHRTKGSGIFDRRLASGVEVPVLEGRPAQTLESWSLDGRYLTFGTPGLKTKWDVWAWKMEEPRQAFPVLTGIANEGHSQLSPDGRFIAYASDESSRFEVYVRAFPTSAATWKISSDGGADPRWRRDGRELYFIAADGKMMAASVTTGGTFRHGPPVPLFATGLEVLWQDTRNHYDVTHDGQRFIVLVPDDRRYGPVTAIRNWQR